MKVIKECFYMIYFLPLMKSKCKSLRSEVLQAIKKKNKYNLIIILYLTSFILFNLNLFSLKQCFIFIFRSFIIMFGNVLNNRRNLFMFKINYNLVRITPL